MVALTINNTSSLFLCLILSLSILKSSANSKKDIFNSNLTLLFPIVYSLGHALSESQIPFSQSSQDFKIQVSNGKPEQVSPETEEQSAGHNAALLNIPTSSFITRILQEQEDNTNEHAGDRILQISSLFALLLGSFIKPNDLSFPFAVCFAKSMEYIYYINVFLPGQIEQDFQFPFRAFSIIDALGFSIPQNLKDQFPNTSLWPIFKDANLHSSYFVNQWRLFVSLAIIFTVMLLIHIVKTLPIISQKAKPSINRVQLIIGWNLFYIVLFNSLDDIALFTIIEFQTLHFDSFYADLSFLTCLAVIAITIFILRRIFQITREMIKTEQSKADKQTSIQASPLLSKSKYQALHTGYKKDSWMQQTYLFWFASRILLCFIIIGCFYNYPLFQTIWIMTLNLIALYYLQVEKPFKQSPVVIVSLVYELLTLFANVFLIVLAFYTGPIEAQKGLGYTVFVIKTAGDVCSHLAMWTYAGLNIYNVLKKIKRNRKDNRVTWQNFYKAIFEENDTLTNKTQGFLLKTSALEVKTETDDQEEGQVKAEDPFVLKNQPSDHLNLLSGRSSEGIALKETIPRMDKESFRKFLSKNSKGSGVMSDKETTVGDLENQEITKTTTEVDSVPKLRIHFAPESPSPRSSPKKAQIVAKINAKESANRTPTVQKIASIIMEEPSIEDGKALSNCNLDLNTERGDKKSVPKLGYSLQSLVLQEKAQRFKLREAFVNSSFGSQRKEGLVDTIQESARLNSNSTPREGRDKDGADSVRIIPTLSSQIESVTDLTAQRNLSYNSQSKRKIPRSRFLDVVSSSNARLPSSITEV